MTQPCCTTFSHAGAAFGPRLPWGAPGVVGELRRVDVSGGKQCEGLRRGDEDAGRALVALVERGQALFVDAVAACQAAGAVAVVVRNTRLSGDSDDALVQMGPFHALASNGAKITVPAVFVSTATGNELYATLDASASASASASTTDPVMVGLFAADDAGPDSAQLSSGILLVAFLCLTLGVGSAYACARVLVACGPACARSCQRARCRRCCRGRGALTTDNVDLSEPLGTSPLSSAAALAALAAANAPPRPATDVKPGPLQSRDAAARGLAFPVVDGDRNLGVVYLPRDPKVGSGARDEEAEPLAESAQQPQ